MNLPLQIIGHMEVPPQVLEHRFVIEALGCAEVLATNGDPKAKVVGTEETKGCELYGWAPNVVGHRDNTGFTYLVGLNDAISYVHARKRVIDTGHGPYMTVRLKPGDVVRLNDLHEHWTEDVTPRVAAFAGSWPEPADVLGWQTLATGINKLASGAYYGAPRVRRGFRVLLQDECIAANSDFEDVEYMLIADAQKSGRMVITCSCCEKPAQRIDDHWPYQWDRNRCMDHLGVPAAAGKALRLKALTT